MKYDLHSHRHALTILQEKEYLDQWKEFIKVLDSISDKDIIKQYPKSSNSMSISAAINDLIKIRLMAKGWNEESPIFNDARYKDGSDKKRWRLDFAKGDISVEVAFNHGEAIAWNLLKPTMASELNHVEKAIQTKIGIIIFANEDMTKEGAFDGAVCSY